MCGGADRGDELEDLSGLEWTRLEGEGGGGLSGRREVKRNCSGHMKVTEGEKEGTRVPFPIAEEAEPTRS